MGLRMSIDKHVSSLDELLDMSALYFNKIKFESKVNPDITQHLKVRSCPRPLTYLPAQIWKFSEDKLKFDTVKTLPVALTQLNKMNFSFKR
jgi:hypothetical protein